MPQAAAPDCRDAAGERIISLVPPGPAWQPQAEIPTLRLDSESPVEVNHSRLGSGLTRTFNGLGS